MSNEASFWDAFSPTYDSFMARTGGVYARFVSRLAADLGHPTTVLDVATGTGTLALHLAASAEHIDGVDAAPGMIALACTKAAAAGAANLGFHVASAYELPFDAGRLTPYFVPTPST